MTDIMIHNVVSISVSDLDKVDGMSGTFYVRDITITDANGHRIVINMFASSQQSDLEIAI